MHSVDIIRGFLQEYFSFLIGFTNVAVANADKVKIGASMAVGIVIVTINNNLYTFIETISVIRFSFAKAQSRHRTRRTECCCP